jgi:hypothetical protein
MAVVEKFPGRILRLFRRGQDEEAKVVSDLRAIGLNVQKTGDNQSRVDFGCHVSGSMDGVIESGVPDAPKTFEALKSRKVLVKNVSTMHPLLTHCLRLTVGTDDENQRLLAALKDSL